MPVPLTACPGDSLQELFDSAPAGSVIRLSAGVYRQKAVIRTPGLTLTGAGREQTRIVFGDYANKRHSDGKEYNTFRTYTLAVVSDDVVLTDLSVSNDAGSPESRGQQVALSVYGDRFHMENCILSSTQDTLFLGPLPEDLIRRYDGFLPDELRQNRMLSQRFDRCRIDGTVDFIFGCGSAVFSECEIRSVHDARKTGFAAAPAHAAEQTDGFRFEYCRFTCTPDVPDESVFLARPWRDFGLAVFAGCSYDRHIRPEGFDPWNDTGRDRTARFSEIPPVPGRVPWINRSAHTDA